MLCMCVYVCVDNKNWQVELKTSLALFLSC